jgi:probable addiction module antidote protein
MNAFAENTIKSLDAAFRTNDLHQIRDAIGTVVHQSSNIVQLAKDAEVDRVALYRAFRFKSKYDPRLDTVVKVLSALGFRLIVKFGLKKAKVRPNLYIQSSKSDDHPELRSNANLAIHLTRAFETAEIKRIVEAFGDSLRAQENVLAFVETIVRKRPSLYRSFSSSRIPRLGTVLIFLHALGLRFSVKSRRENRDQTSNQT